MNKPPAFEGLNIRIPIIIPMKGRGFINHGSGLDRKMGPTHPESPVGEGGGDVGPYNAGASFELISGVLMFPIFHR